MSATTCRCRRAVRLPVDNAARRSWPLSSNCRSSGSSSASFGSHSAPVRTATAKRRNRHRLQASDALGAGAVQLAPRVWWNRWPSSNKQLGLSFAEIHDIGIETLARSRYALHFVRHAIQAGRTVVVMRAFLQWRAVLPEMETYGRLFRLKNPYRRLAFHPTTWMGTTSSFSR